MQELALHEWGIDPEAADMGLVEQLMPAYIRRKRWEWRQLAETILGTYAEALGAKPAASGATAAPAPQPPPAANQSTLVRGASGQVWEKVSPSQLMGLVQSSRV